MAEVVDLGTCDGFFKDLYINIEKSCNKEDLRQFTACKTDEERIRFMHNVKAFKDLKYSRVYSAKNDGAAQNFKNEGNLAFQLRQWKLALDFYNKCVLMTPVDNGMYAYIFWKFNHTPKVIIWLRIAIFFIKLFFE